MHFARSRTDGNPAVLACFLDESLNGVLARVCRAAHRSVWTYRVLSNFEETESRKGQEAQVGGVKKKHHEHVKACLTFCTRPKHGLFLDWACAPTSRPLCYWACALNADPFPSGMRPETPTQ